MKTQAFEHFNLQMLPTWGMLLFLGAFIGILLWTLRKDRNAEYESLKNLPISEE